MTRTGNPAKPTMEHIGRKLAIPPLYQLHRRVERVASELEGRRRHGWVATKEYIADLYDISVQLKVLDSAAKRN